MIGEKKSTMGSIKGRNIVSSSEYLKTESGISLPPDIKYEIIKHFDGDTFQILERTKDFSRARAIADFHTLGSENTQTIIYSPYG